MEYIIISVACFFIIFLLPALFLRLQNPNKHSKASEEKYRRLFESAKDGILIMNAHKGIIEDVNPFLISFLGYPAEYFIGKELWEIGLFEDVAASRKAFKELQENEYIRYDDLPLQSKNGKKLDVEFISNVYIVGNKKVIQCNIRDITERKKMQTENQKNNIFLSQLIAEQPVVFFITTVKDFRITYISDNVKKITGYTATEFIENNHLWSDNLDPADKLWLLPTLDEKIALGKGNFGYKWKCADGKVKSFLSSFIIKTEHDEDFIYGTWIDINERKKSEEKMESQYQKLIKTNIELDRFVYSTSHDLRAPLTSLQGLISIVEENLKPEETEQKELVNMMMRSVTKLDDFISDILFYSYNARSVVEKDEINFEELIAESRENLRYQGTTAITYSVVIQQIGKFISDKKRINIVLNNLISNANKYSDGLKKESFVNITVESDKNQAIVIIEDNGIGIAEVDHDKIFEMFYRGTTLSSGSGLGMYILKETLEKLDGNIQMESQLKKGTKFTIILPNLIIN